MSEVDQLLKRAEEAFSKRNYDYARDLYLNALLKEPNNEKARKELYTTCLKKNQETGGPGRLKQMADLAVIKTQLQTVKNNPVKRVELSLKYLCGDPTNSSVRTALASGLRDQSFWGAAAVEAEIAYSNDSKNFEAAKILVAARTNLGQVKEAQAILERLGSEASADRDIMKLSRDLAAKQSSSVFKDGANTDYHDVIKNKEVAAQLEKNTQLIKTEADFKAVIAHLEEQHSAEPTEPRIPQKIGQIWFDFKKDYETAKQWFTKASQLAPQDSMLRDKIEECNLRTVDAQLEAAEKAGAPNVAELRATRLRTLIATYERRVADRPTDMGLHFELGKAYFQAGKNYLDKAVGEFQQSVKDPKKKIESHVYLGRSFQKKALFDLADGQYQKAEEAGVVGQNVLLTIWYYRAVCNAEAKKVEKAIDFGKKIMEVDISFKDISALVDRWNGGGAAAAENA